MKFRIEVSYKLVEDYSPTNFLRIFSESPFGTSAACLGTHSDLPVTGLSHLSCRPPCRSKTHPASLKTFNNSDVFIIYKSSLSFLTLQR